MKSYMAKPSEVERKWYVVDADGQTLGRLSSRIALILMGKHRPTYTPHVDTGDFVIVINADKIRLTGKKLQQKTYFRHSEYPGGGKETLAADMLREKPERMIELAVKGMLPKNRMASKMMKRLRIFKGNEHVHEAQMPESITL